MYRKVFLILIAILASLPALIGSAACTPNPGIKYVYGFWPYWIDPGSYQPDWGSLSHISYFSLDATADGGLDTQNIGPAYYYIREKAHSQNVKVTLTIGCFDCNTQDAVLANHQDQLVNAIIDKLQEYSADGICVDIEEVKDTNSVTGGSNKVLIQKLMENLHSRVKKANPEYDLCFCVTGNVENVYRNPALADLTDTVFLMGYEYHWSKAPETGAISPFNDPEQPDIAKSLEMLKKWYPAEKLIVGLPFYGYDWPCDSNAPGARTTGEGSIVTMYAAEAGANSYGRMWDPASHTPWYSYQAAGAWHQCWYEDNESLALKFNYLNTAGVAGVGFWALGFEGTASPVWPLVRQSFKRQ